MPKLQRYARIALISLLLGAGTLAAGVSRAQSTAGLPIAVSQAYQELFAQSLKDKRGLMIYVRGQAIGGAVNKVMGNDAVEIRNQTYGRIIIRMDQIDAVAIN
jgi:hypothetical protein